MENTNNIPKEYLKVKEFAEQTGLTTQRVYQMLGKELKDYCQIVNNHKFIKKEALKQFIKQQNPNFASDSPNDLVNYQDDLPNIQVFTKHLQNQINTLQKHNVVLTQQLIEKDKQLLEKDAQIKALTSALTLAQENTKTLTDALSTAQALHAGTIQERLTTQSENLASDESNLPFEQRKSLFARFFRKK